MTILLGLCGAKYAGKTSTFNILKELNPAIQEITLAKQMKKVCSRVFSLPMRFFDDPSLKEAQLTQPVYLSTTILEALLIAYNLPLKRDLYRKHVGKTLDTPRRILQYVGTEFLRTIELQIHCRVANDSLKSDTKVAVVTDIRFPDEREFFEKHSSNFMMVYVRNTKAENVANTDTHASEKYLTDLKLNALIIDNDGTLADLRNEIKSKLGSFLSV